MMCALEVSAPPIKTRRRSCSTRHATMNANAQNPHPMESTGLAAEDTAELARVARGVVALRRIP